MEKLFEDIVAVEHTLMLVMESGESFEVACTADEYLKELVIGRLYTEGFITEAADVKNLDFSNDKSSVRVSVISEGKKHLQPEKIKKASVDMPEVKELINIFEENARLADDTGAMHSCMIWAGGKVRCTAYDMGRNNAIDKAVGMALEQKLDLRVSMLFTSARVPAGIVGKAVNAGIPVVIARGAPTSAAIELAKAHDIRLLAFASRQRVNIYC